MSQAVKKNPDATRPPITVKGLLRGVQLVAGMAALAGLAWGGVALYHRYDVPVAVIGVKGELEQVKAAEVEQIVAASLGGVRARRVWSTIPLPVLARLWSATPGSRAPRPGASGPTKW